MTLLTRKLVIFFAGHRLRGIWLLSVILICGGCAKSPTGLDLTDNYSAEFAYQLSISHTSALLRCPRGEYPGILTINGRTFGEEYWWPAFEIDDYTYYEYPNIYGAPGIIRDTTDYVLTKGDKTFSGRIMRPGVPIVNLPDLDLDRDYTIRWSADPQPMYFILKVNFMDDNPDKYIQLSGKTRSYKVKKSHWAGQDWYMFSVSLNSTSYRAHGKELLVMQSTGWVSNWVLPPE